jgi:hypothetical protein
MTDTCDYLLPITEPQKVIRTAAVAVAFRTMAGIPIIMHEITEEITSTSESDSFFDKHVRQIIAGNDEVIQKFAKTIVFWATHIDL